MLGFALGVIETLGLTAAITAADAALKAANVRFVGYEKTRGTGLIVVKFKGDVAAVNAAVEAGCMAASSIGKVRGKTVIPRPDSGIEMIVDNTDEMEGIIASSKDYDESDENIRKKEVIKKETAEQDNKLESKLTEKEVSRGNVKKIDKLSKIKSKKDVCNLCGDIECPRVKGEPKVLCIHYKKIKEEI